MKVSSKSNHNLLKCAERFSFIFVEAFAFSNIGKQYLIKLYLSTCAGKYEHC